MAAAAAAADGLIGVDLVVRNMPGGCQRGGEREEERGERRGKYFFLKIVALSGVANPRQSRLVQFAHLLCPNFFLKKIMMLAQRLITLILMMINSCRYSTNDLVSVLEFN